jgi:hypothetical protein
MSTPGPLSVYIIIISGASLMPHNLVLDRKNRLRWNLTDLTVQQVPELLETTMVEHKFASGDTNGSQVSSSKKEIKVLAKLEKRQQCAHLIGQQLISFPLLLLFLLL